MNAEEHRLLHNFLEQLTAVERFEKDPEADRLIRNAVSRQPDAAYLLVQRAMILEQALEQARAEMARLQQQASQTPSTRSQGFLDANAWGKSGRSANAAGSGQEWSAAGTPIGASGSRSASPYPPSSSSPSAYSGFSRQAGGPGARFGGSAGSSFLGTMAATAAGVAGGAFLFHGIGNLLDGSDDPGGSASPDNDSGGTGTASETPPQSLAEPDAGTQDLAADDSGSLFDDPYGFDPGSGEDSLL